MALIHSLACLLLPTPFGILVPKRSPYFTLGMCKVHRGREPRVCLLPEKERLSEQAKDWENGKFVLF